MLRNMKESTAWWLFHDRGFVFLVHALEPLLATERKATRRLLCYFACPSLFGEGDGALTIPCDGSVGIGLAGAAAFAFGRGELRRYMPAGIACCSRF